MIDRSSPLALSLSRDRQLLCCIIFHLCFSLHFRRHRSNQVLLFLFLPFSVTDHSILTLSLSKWNFTHGSLCIYARCDACASDVLVIKQEDVMTSCPNYCVLSRIDPKSIDTLDIMKQISSFDLPPKQYQIKASVHHSPYFGKRSEHISCDFCLPVSCSYVRCCEGQHGF